MASLSKLQLALEEQPARRLVVTLEDRMSDEVVTSEGTIAVQGCVEVGNSRTAAIFIGPDGQQRTTWMPSVKSVSGASLYELRQRRELRTGDHCLTTKEGSVEIDEFVGQLALIGGNVEAQNARGSRERGSDGWNRSFVLASVKAAYPYASDITLDLVTCIPADWWTAEIEAATIKAMRGTYQFKYNGAEQWTTVRIRSVTLQREGYASWFAPGIDRKMGRVLILNGGGDTLNVVEVIDGELGNYRTLNRLGVEVVFDELSTYLKSQGKRTLTEAERIELAAALRDGKEYSITIGGKKERVDHFARSFLDKKASTSVSLVKKAIPSYRHYDNIYYVGGAAYGGLMGSKFKAELPEITIPTGVALEMTDALGALAASVGKSVKAGKGRR